MSRVQRMFLAVVAAGVPAALVWWWLGEPSSWLATENGLVLTEQNAVGQFQVIAVFTVVGVVVGVAAGVLAARFCGPGRWQTVLALACAALVSAVLCSQLGFVLGPPPPGSVTGVEVGDLVPDQLVVDTVVPFLIWPFAALLAYATAFYLGSDGVHDAPDDVWADDDGAVTARSQP